MDEELEIANPSGPNEPDDASLETDNDLLGADGEPNEQETPQDTAPAAEAVAQEPAARPQRQAPPLPGDIDGQLRTNVEALLGTEGLSAIDAYIDRKLNARDQFAAAQNYHVQADMTQHPEWYRENAGTVQKYLSQLPPNVRATPQGLAMAKTLTIMEDAESSGDWASTLAFHAQRMGGNKSAQKPTAVPATPIPASQRVPAATGTGTRAANRREERVDNSAGSRLARRFDLSANEADSILRDERRRA